MEMIRKILILILLTLVTSGFYLLYGEECFTVKSERAWDRALGTWVPVRMYYCPDTNENRQSHIIEENCVKVHPFGSDLNESYCFWEVVRPQWR